MFVHGVPGSLVGDRPRPGGGILTSTPGAAQWCRSSFAAPWRSYAASMHASEMAEDFPVVTAQSDAWDAVTQMAERRLPGLVVTDAAGKPVSVLPASQVVRILVPSYVQDDPSLAGVLSERMCDRVADKLRGKTVQALVPADAQEPAMVNADDTIVEVAAVMARLRSPLAAVMEGDTLVGVITASRLLQLALTPR
jgi:CBS domain-containing protein